MIIIAKTSDTNLGSKPLPLTTISSYSGVTDVSNF